MSGQVPLLRTLSRATGSADAMYFDSGQHRLFGWLHRGSDALRTEMGVVLCQPFGYESICAHRGIRAFAEAIADAGMPALRFDYSGTGDSSDIDPQADQLRVWTQDVLAAAEFLKRQTGVRQVCLIGFRLGALLATAAASEDSAVSALVVVSPIVVGRRYLRELKTTRLAASIGVRSDPHVEAQNASSGGMEVSGFTLSAATLEALAKVDLSSLQASLLTPMLIIDRVSGAVTRLPAESSNVQADTTRLTLPGLVEMLMTPPQFATVPKELIAETLAWLLKRRTPAAGSPDISGIPTGRTIFSDPVNESTLTGGGGAGRRRLDRKARIFRRGQIVVRDRHTAAS